MEDGPLSATNNGNYSWEEQYKRSWDVIQEDQNGRIATSRIKMNQLLARRRRYIAKLDLGCISFLGTSMMGKFFNAAF